MNISVSQQWVLKDKKGNPPPPNVQNFISKLNKEFLLPCPRSADDLEMPQKEKVPREMNSFIVFRRQLAYVAKTLKSSEDGRLLSTAASYIWNGASKNEKMSYTLVAEELKRRHRIKNPDYTYERRKRKTAEEDFIIIDPDTMMTQTQRKKKKPRKSQPEPNASAAHVSEEQESAPILTVIQEEENGEWLTCPLTSCFDPYCDNSFDDNECFEHSRNHELRDEEIGQVYQNIMARNYTADLGPELQLQSQQIPVFFNYQQTPQQSIQQPQFQLSSFEEFDFNTFFNGNRDMGMNPSSYMELARPIDEIRENLF